MPNEKPILFSGEMVRAILAGTKSHTRRVLKPQPSSFELDPKCEIDGEHPAPWWTFDRATTDKIEYTRDHSPLPSKKRQLQAADWLFGYHKGAPRLSRSEVITLCPYGRPGDRLWVKENHFLTPPYWADHESDYNVWDCEGNGRIAGYVATMDSESIRCAHDYRLRQRPSIHMPRWASRLTLEITGVRVERLQDISEEDAKAEGVSPLTFYAGRKALNRCNAPQYRKGYSHLWDTINADRGFGWDENPWCWVVSFRRVEQPAPALNAPAAAL